MSVCVCASCVGVCLVCVCVCVCVCAVCVCPRCECVCASVYGWSQIQQCVGSPVQLVCVGCLVNLADEAHSLVAKATT